MNGLMDTNTASATETITFNEEVTKIFVSVANQATNQKSGKPRTNKNLKRNCVTGTAG